MWWQIEVFDHFWPISSSLLMFVWQFLVPCRRQKWDLLIHLRPSVTPYLEIRASDFDDFCTKLHLDESKKCSKRIFEKILVSTQNSSLFGWKMAFWAYIFETAHQILMIFSQMLDIIALNDLASVLCARKFSFAPLGGIYPKNCPPFS